MLRGEGWGEGWGRERVMLRAVSCGRGKDMPRSVLCGDGWSRGRVMLRAVLWGDGWGRGEDMLRYASTTLTGWSTTCIRCIDPVALHLIAKQMCEPCPHPTAHTALGPHPEVVATVEHAFPHCIHEALEAQGTNRGVLLHQTQYVFDPAYHSKGRHRATGIG